MDKKELEELRGMAEVESVQRMEIKAGDVIVIKLRGHASMDNILRLKAQLEEGLKSLPEHKTMVIDESIVDIQVFTKAE